MATKVAVVGAECSGKSTLCWGLRGRLGGLIVPEFLRTFVEQHQRVPLAEEQHKVLAGQIAHEEVAAQTAGVEWVWSDSGVLMTAVYSLLYYDDDSLLAPALEHHRSYQATIWCDIDLPWTPDEGQRDGPAFRQRGHDLLATVLQQADFPVLAVTGSAAQRVAQVVPTLT